MYRIIISNSAEKDMNKLPKVALKKVEHAIDHLADNPRPRGCKKLKGIHEDLWRIRVGDYRVIYTVEDKIEIIDIRRVRHRGEVYED
jgi:mRNA interferase RelE/StbE